MSLVNAIRELAEPGQITGEIQVPARPSQHADWPAWVPIQVLRALQATGINRPWTHQVLAADSIHAGRHTVLASGTGSGKSLAAWVPILSQLVAAHRPIRSLAEVAFRPTALYLAPTKALAADQLASLTALAKDVDSTINVATADGDTEGPLRTFAQDYADIVLTNPDFVHHVLLPRHARWHRLLRGLTLVVVDEFHSYRGMFGGHVAHVVRRILRLAQHYGAHPAVLFLSATAADPATTAQRFLGPAFGNVTAVEEDGSPRGAQTILLWQCKKIDPAEQFHPVPTGSLHTASAPEAANTAAGNQSGGAASNARRAANTEAGILTAELVAHGARCLTFVRSRPGTERVAEVARQYLSEHVPGLDHAVAAYRGGYLPEERRELEGSLRSGALRALATTNALELGIDISGLDAVVVTGWPGTRASFDQQVGRAGRAGKEGLGIFIGRDNPLDQYMITHPDQVAGGEAEANVFDPMNPHVLGPEICAAAAELPLTEADCAVFGLNDAVLFNTLTEEGLLRRRPTGWFWNTGLGASAHSVVDLRGEGTTVSIVESESGTVLGTVDSARADTTVFPGAVYIHQGAPFEVDSLLDDVAMVHPVKDELRTFTREESSVEIERVTEELDTGIGVWTKGEVVVTSRVVGYDVRRARDGVYLGFVPLDMPVRELHTQGTWWTINQAAITEADVTTDDLAGALHAAEHASIGLLPLFATADRWDIGGLSTVAHPDTGRATVIVHDSMTGGNGAAYRGFDVGLEWMRATLGLLDTCPCLDGCPRCVQSPKCGNNNHPLSKAGARRILRRLIEAMATVPKLAAHGNG